LQKNYWAAKVALLGLEQCAVKIASTVLMRGVSSNAVSLADCDTKSSIRAVVLCLKIPPSMLLDEPTIMNKELIGKSSEVEIRDKKCKHIILLIAIQVR
jgi:hypothetical protein